MRSFWNGYIISYLNVGVFKRSYVIIVIFTSTESPMDLERIIEWVIVGILLVVGLSILGVLLDLAVGLLWFGVKLLVIVVGIMAVVRFFQYLSGGSAH